MNWDDVDNEPQAGSDPQDGERERRRRERVIDALRAAMEREDTQEKEQDHAWLSGNEEAI